MQNSNSHTSDCEISDLDWGCAEFRETIAWMRERWPELAAEAEHPLLEAMLAAREAGDDRKLKQLTPGNWFRRKNRFLLLELMATPLKPREMLAIEMALGRQDYLEYTDAHRSSFWTFYTGCAVLQIILSLLLMTAAIMNGFGGLILFSGFGLASGFMQYRAASIERELGYSRLRDRMMAMREHIQRATGIIPGIKQHVIIGVFSIYLTWLIFSYPWILISWIMIVLMLPIAGTAVAVSILFRPAKNRGTVFFMNFCEAEFEAAEIAYKRIMEREEQKGTIKMSGTGGRVT